MSTTYKNSSDVPLDTLANRLRELSDAILGGRVTQSNEFTMRTPAECDRDADIVLSESAARLEAVRDYNAQLQDDLTAAKAEIERLRGRASDLEATLYHGNIEREKLQKAFILRKQAETVDSWADYQTQNLPPDHDLTEMGWHAKRIYERAKDYAQRLYQQADDLQKAGGE